MSRYKRNKQLVSNLGLSTIRKENVLKKVKKRNGYKMYQNGIESRSFGMKKDVFNRFGLICTNTRICINSAF